MRLYSSYHRNISRDLYEKFQDLRAIGIHEECLQAFNDFQQRICTVLPRISASTIGRKSQNNNI